jgi:nucleoside-diphosphate-sugar epimerase
MRVVIIGATGNHGSSLARQLSHDPAVDTIVGVARRLPELPIPKVEWVARDITRDDLVDVLDGADAVVHLAWLIQPGRDERVTYATNVDGSRRVLAAAARAGVRAIVYASSVGAYAVGPKDRLVDESWPTSGIPTSFYSRHKAAVERILDGFEAANPQVRVVRVRPGLVFKREAATEIRRLFVGPLLPNALVRRRLIPVVPDVRRLRFQALHTDDLAQAYRLALLREDARGAYNVAAEPVLDPRTLAEALHARRLPLPGWLLRAGAAATYRLRLQPSEPGWVDMALGVPLMDTSRARRELGWEPRRTSVDTLMDLLAGLRDGAGLETPPLAPATSGPARIREVLTGVGQR